MSPLESGQEMFDVAVLIGRFQPFHNGHATLLEDAFSVGRKVVLVLGSAGAAPSPRNPFSAVQRESMIRASLDVEKNARLVVVGQRDVWDTPRWAEQVQAAVSAAARGTTALVGHHKDATSAYLDHFPQWSMVEIPRRGPLDATPLREQILSQLGCHEVLEAIRGSIPAGTMRWLENWAIGPQRQDLTHESIAISRYREKWRTGPFLAADAVVRCGGSVLLVRRATALGKGLWALPGGLALPGEQLEDAARREAKERTGFDLAGIRPTGAEVFAHPGRSLRGRIATHVFLYELDLDEAPAVKCGERDSEAAWVPITELASLESRLFEDHFHILDRMLGGILAG